MSVASSVTEMARPVVEGLGLSLWDVEFVKEQGRQVLRIVIDHPDGVSINHCEAVSRELEPLLDERDPIPVSYVLQVSSAGLERVLKRPGDFELFYGKKVEVSLYAPRDKCRVFSGVLLSYDRETVTIEGEEPFVMKSVAQVRLVYDCDL